MSDSVIGKMKTLFVADFQSEFQLGMLKALQALGWVVEKFSWQNYIPESIWGKVQERYIFGSVIKRINEALIEECNSLKPDVVFIYKGIYFWPQTITQLKDYTRLVVSYHPDNPFGNYNADYAKRYRIKENMLLNKIVTYEKSLYLPRRVDNFIKAIPSYDINFVPRVENIGEYKNVGAREVYLLRRYYIPELHRPMELTEDDKKRFESDVIFIGHFEPDQRTECLEALLDVGVRVRLFGGGWNRSLSRELRKAFGTSIRPLYGEEYVKALCASKIALCFLSKLNKDTSTIRSFEIPACGTLLLSERTDEMKELFEEDKEAVYFSDKEELVQKVQLLLEEPEKRNAIAIAGHRRCISDGHDVVSRMRGWSDTVCAKLNV